MKRLSALSLGIIFSCFAFSVSSAFAATVIEKSCISEISLGSSQQFESADVDLHIIDAYNKAIKIAVCPTDVDMSCPAGTIDIGITKREQIDSTTGFISSRYNGLNTTCNQSYSGSGQYIMNCRTTVRIIKSCVLP